MRRLIAMALGTALLQGCATITGPKRTFTFAAAGGATGAIAGSILSPDKENQALNALVFGLTGILVGGAAGMLTDRPAVVQANTSSFFNDDLRDSTGKEVNVTPYDSLPEYVRKRLQPLVIEEFVETDQVDEDGVLRESHKAYRIKRQPEFNPRPVQESIISGSEVTK